MILAGGRSSRFGSDKALARWRGATFLERVHAAVAPAAHQVSILARADHAAAYAALLSGVRVLPDREPFAGPMHALLHALDATDAPRIPDAFAARNAPDAHDADDALDALDGVGAHDALQPRAADGQVLVASVDMPGLRVGQVRALVAAGRDAIAYAVRPDGPLPTLLSGPAGDLRSRLAGARRLLDVVDGGRAVALDGPGLNVNHPEA